MSDERDEEVARLRAWVADLQSGMYVNCVYCGHRYGPGETTPVSMADALKAHIEVCQEHPLARTRAVLRDLLMVFGKPSKSEKSQRAYEAARALVMIDSVPCKFCGKPLQHELACPYLVKFEPGPLDDKTGAMNRAEFSRPVVKLVGGEVVYLCRREA